MESNNILSFSTHAPFKQPIVITHYISMVIAFLGFYPLLLTRQIRRQKVYILSASFLFLSIGFISGSFISISDESSLVLRIFAFILLSLVISQAVLLAYRSDRFSSLFPTPFSKIPKWVDLAFGWISLIVAFTYLALAALVFTESCNHGNDQQSQCLMPVAMGTGFVLYGTLSMLHLLAIVKLPRPSTPEYYEGVILTFWGFISLFLGGTPILGSEWRAINLGLLWFTGGLFSITLSVQTWIPALRERNIINSLIIALTGRAVVTGLTQSDDTYAAQVHTMLGYIFIIGALARLTQIIFRKSPAENLPHRMFQQNTDTTLDIDDDDEEEAPFKDNLHQHKCKHTFIFATVTLIFGLLASLLAICGGFLFMGANIGWIRYMRYYIEDPSTYVNVTLAISFLWSVYVFGLCTLYKNLKAKNALHQYEYLELNHNPSSSMTDLPLRHNHHFEREEEREWPLSAVSHPPPNTATTNTNSAVLRADSPPLQYHQPEYTTMSTSPTMIAADSTMPLSYTTSSPPTESTTITLEKTIRPSEYRAKRRSLLIQSPVPNTVVMNPNTRARSSSGFGVGGVLPDEIVQLQKTPTPVDPTFRRSWLSSGSSVGYYSGSVDSSSAPNSPNCDQQRPHSLISSTLPPQYSTTRRSSMNESSFGGEYNHGLEQVILSDDNTGRRSSDNNGMNNNDTIISNSSGSKFQRWSLRNESNNSHSSKK